MSRYRAGDLERWADLARPRVLGIPDVAGVETDEVVRIWVWSEEAGRAVWRRVHDLGIPDAVVRIERPAAFLIPYPSGDVRSIENVARSVSAERLGLRPVVDADARVLVLGAWRSTPAWRPPFRGSRALVRCASRRPDGSRFGGADWRMKGSSRSGGDSRVVIVDAVRGDRRWHVVETAGLKLRAERDLNLTARRADLAFVEEVEFEVRRRYPDIEQVDFIPPRARSALPVRPGR